MREVSRVLVGLVGLLVASSCRTATKVVEVPRVDLEPVGGGNRGYLIGTAPAGPERSKTTRQMVETDVEIPSLYTPRAGGAGAVSLGEVAPPEVDLSEEELLSESGLPQVYETYVVKPGETLWSIAARPEVFGDATKWRRLYEANHDILKSPDRIRPGMSLRVPRGASGQEGPAQKTTTFVK
jgi:nucleoid-associated protein YgaU